MRIACRLSGWFIRLETGGAEQANSDSESACILWDKFGWTTCNCSRVQQRRLYACFDDGNDLQPLPVSYPSGDPLEPVPETDTTSTHPHMFLQHPVLPLIYVVDLAQNALHTYELKSNRLVYQRTLEILGGPRHMRLNKAATRGWIVTETSSMVVPLSIDYEGIVRLNGDRSSLLTEPGKVKGAGGEILLTSDEKYIVASNRQVKGDQNDFLTMLEVKEGGSLGAAQYTDTMGQRVRGMAFNEDSSHLIVGNQSNDTIAVFLRDSDTRKLKTHLTLI